jgi:hypothetical protein
MTLVDQTQQDVLGADEAVVQQARLFLRQHEHRPRLVREAFEHASSVRLRWRQAKGSGL